MRQNKSLKIIDQIKIESPCNELWEKMQGSESARHCESCVHTVRNLSALTKNQAEKVLRNRGSSRLCIRYEIKANGEIKFKEGFSWKYFRHIQRVILASICTVLGFGTLATAENKTVQPQEMTESVKMGELPMVIPTPSPTPEKAIMGDYATPSNHVKSDNIPKDRILMGKVAAPKSESK